MDSPTTDRIRNVALVGHGGAGKTSIAEAILHVTGVTTRLGSVDTGHSNLDYDPEELRRKSSVSLGLAPVERHGLKLNFIDTPGYADFIGDAIGGLAAAEIALFVVDAISGPQVQTDRLWKIAGEIGVPRAILINRLDKEHADFDECLRKLRDRYGAHIGAIQVPMGAEGSFRGVIDVVRMKAYHHEGDHEVISEIPDELAESATTARDALTELVVEADDELMEKYLIEGESLSQEELELLLRDAITQGIFVPVFVSSATTLEGVEDLLDAIAAFFPAPASRAIPRVNGTDQQIAPSDSTSAFVFKTLSDPYVGRLSLVKVVTGTLTPNSELTNVRTGRKERIGHVLRMTGKETADVRTVHAGDIAVVPKLSDTLTGDTLAASPASAYDALSFPEPLYPVAIQAKTKADEDKLGTALNKLVEEEPTLKLIRHEETHQTVLAGIGDVQIDIALARLRDRYHAEAETVDLRIPYRETIRKVAQAQGRHKKQTGGSGQFGDCWLRLEPNPGGGYEFKDEIVGGRIPRQFIPAVDKGVQETMSQGVLAGYPVVDVKVAVYDGSYHAVDSSEIAFKTAARLGFRAAAEKADMVLLEPIATLQIDVPDEYAGAVMGDISSMRGRILGMDSSGNGQRIRAQVPYAEVVHYSPHLRSITSGTGVYTIAVEGYEQVPGDMAMKIIAAAKSSRESGQ